MRCIQRAVACGLVVSMLLLTACASMQSGEPIGGCGTWSSPSTCIAAHSAGGAVLGALTGILTAKLTKADTGKGALIGAGAGGLMAFAWAWGKCFACFTKVRSQQVGGYDETKASTGYSPNQGTALKIGNATLSPSAVAPGNKIAFRGDYYVMFPNEKKEMSITETAILKAYDAKERKWVEVGRSPETVIVAPGSRKADSEIPIPDIAEEGKFLMVFTITADGKSVSAEMPFTVTKNREVLARAEAEAAATMAAEQKQQVPDAIPTTIAKTEETPLPPTVKAVETAPLGEKSIQIEKYVIIAVGKVNFRETPNTRAKILGSGSKNEKYLYVGTQVVDGKKWHEIKINESTSAWLIGTAGNVKEK